MTNAAIILAPPSMLNPEFKPSSPLPLFNKHLLGAEHGDEAQGGGLRLQLGLHLQVLTQPDVPAPGDPWCWRHHLKT